MSARRKIQKIRAYRVDQTDEHGKGWYGFVAAGNRRGARTQAHLWFDCPDRTIDSITGPFEIDERMVTNV